MTAIINNVVVQGKPEEIKELLDLQKETDKIVIAKNGKVTEIGKLWGYKNTDFFQKKPKPDYQTYLGVDVEIICGDCLNRKECSFLKGKEMGICSKAQYTKGRHCSKLETRECKGDQC